MKTLSHYQKLREDYACIIPKTAPAWELIEAIDDLIKLIQPPVENQPHFLGVPVNLPEGWAISVNHSNNLITLKDNHNYRRGVVYPNIKGDLVIWWDGKYKTTLKTKKEAIEWLCNKANKS